MIDTLWSDQVELQVQLGIGREDDETFTLDDAVLGTLDGPGRLGSEDAPFMDATCDVRRATWRSGATRTDGVITRWESGTATIVLDNRDDFYDIADPDSRLTPMIGVRIRARATGATEWKPMWTGFADQWSAQWSPDDATVTVTCSDGVKLLANYDAPEQSPVGDGETAAQRVNRILDEAEWQADRRVNAGGHALNSTTMADNAWSQLLLVQDAELGATYVDKDGALVFYPRNLWLDRTQTDVVASWGPSALRYEDAEINNDDQNYRNIVDAARTGGTEHTVRNQADVNYFGPHRWGRNDLPLKLEQDVIDWANVVLQTSLSLQPRVDSLDVLPMVANDSWSVVLDANYGDRWTVVVNPPWTPTDVVRRVQLRGWEHEVTYETWRVKYALSDARVFQLFQLDSPDEDARLDIMRLG